MLLYNITQTYLTFGHQINTFKCDLHAHLRTAPTLFSFSEHKFQYSWCNLSCRGYDKLFQFIIIVDIYLKYLPLDKLLDRKVLRMVSILSRCSKPLRPTTREFYLRNLGQCFRNEVVSSIQIPLENSSIRDLILY